MPRDWTNQRTVASVLRDAGYYPEDASLTRQDLQAQMVEEEQVDIAGKSYTLSRISKYDIKLFADQLDRVASRLNPFIWDIYAKYAEWCLTALRLANVNSKQGFRGAGSSGNELDFTMMNAREFYDPDNSASARTTWVRTISSTGSKNFVEGVATGTVYTLGEETCHIYLAMYNPALDPCVDSLQIQLNTDAFNIQDLDFNKLQSDLADPIIELREPFIIPPEEAYEILSYYFQTGTDEMRPIGLMFKEAKNLRNLASILEASAT
jgi:hypothetical protein